MGLHFSMCLYFLLKNENWLCIFTVHLNASAPSSAGIYEQLWLFRWWNNKVNIIVIDKLILMLWKEINAKNLVGN